MTAPTIGHDTAPWPTFESTPDIIRPLSGWCIIVRDDPLPTKVPGLLVPASAKKEELSKDAMRGIMATAFVVACGPPAVLQSGDKMDCPVKPGDRVLSTSGSLSTYKGKDKNGADVVYEAIQFNRLAGVIEDDVPEGNPQPSLELG